jgi:uncharacterized membrane protein
MDNRHFSINVDIAARPERVWEVMSDVERWHEWTASVTSIKRLDKGPFAVGSRAIIRQPKFPPALWTVTAIEPNRFTWKSGLPGLWVLARHSVGPAPGGSHVTLSLEYTGLFGSLAGKLTRGITERYLKLEAEGLKRRSEAA